MKPIQRYLIFALATLFQTVHTAYDIAQEKIIICGVGKNIAHCLPNMMRKIEDLGKSFKEYHVFIYENNSNDASAQILQQWSQRNNKVWVQCEQVSYNDLCKRVKSLALRDKAPCRMEMIAYARNIVLEQAMQPEYDDFKFIMMTDLDFGAGWNIDGVLSTFNLNEEWDGITSHGTNGGSLHYDRYAFRDHQFPLGPELLGETFWKDIGTRQVHLQPMSGLHNVYSAFGGMAIYKRDALYQCSYSGYVTEDLTKLLDQIINHTLPKDHPHYTWYKNIIGSSQNPLPITYQRNSGYDGPVCCEHATLHATMILKGHDKLFVNPKMICRY